MFFKKILKFFLLSVCFVNFSFAEQSIITERFIIVKDKFDSQNSVIEIFSYKCIHCYNHHKFGTLNKLKKDLPNLNYRLYPVSLADKQFGKELNKLFAFAQAKDSENGKDASYEDSLVHKLADYLFVMHFVKQQELKNTGEIEQIASNILNASKDELEKFLKSPKAKEILADYEKANEIARAYGTPTFIVDGEYQIKAADLTSMQNLLDLIKFANGWGK